MKSKKIPFRPTSKDFPPTHELLLSTFKKVGVIICGGAVYKLVVDPNAPITSDIDVIFSDKEKLVDLIKPDHPSAFYLPEHWSKTTSFNLESSDFNRIGFFDNLMVNVDVASVSEFTNQANVLGLSMINSLVETKDGIRHVLEVPELAESLAFETANPSAEREWVISKLKNAEYCDWMGIRQKDKMYFKTWKKIDPVECAMHGMFKNIELKRRFETGTLKN